MLTPTTPRGDCRPKLRSCSTRPVSVLVSAYLLLLLASLSHQDESSTIAVQQLRNLPDLTSATSDEPIVAFVGQDAFVSCIAKNLQNYTIIWRFTSDASAPAALIEQDLDESSAKILTAGRQRVIADERFSAIESHETWLLKISNVTLADTGTYICHTNSKPRVRNLRILSVLKGPTSGEGQSSELKVSKLGEIDYNFTDCCRAEYVVPRCQRLCSFQQLASRYQSINIVHECFSALPSITRCMVAGRNVTDCCQKRHIPSSCNPMCGHLGDTSAMSVQDQSYCADYSASIMSCVAEGIESLPGQPELVIVEAVSSTTLKVSWQKSSDLNELRKIDGWIINLTKLSSFEDSISDAAASSTTSTSTSTTTAATTTQVGAKQLSTQQVAAAASPLATLTIVDVMNNSSLLAMTRLLQANNSTVSLKLDKQSTEFSIDNLKAYTVYQIQMFAYNSQGRSQLTDPIRALTLAPESDSATTNDQDDDQTEPTLPDTRKCCLDRGVTLKRCLDTLCDPVEADRATIADLMICAPWSNVTFSCISSRVNHTDCCKARGVSSFCLSLCSADIKRVDYRHFRCLTHMSTYTNCILESHNVLPSAPRNFSVGPITHSWAVLNWRPPQKHATTLQGFRIFWRKVEPSQSSASNQTSLVRRPGSMGDPSWAQDDDFFYSSAEAATNPYLLDALQPETVYETFVVAVNKFGQSQSSSRFVFQTLAEPDKLKSLSESQSSRQGQLESRLPLHGNTKTDADLERSSYNETNCCVSSGVHSNCRQLCDYQMKVSDVSSLITNCNSQMPIILRCMAGSRNSVPCCRNRGVNDQCLNVCAGLTEHSPLVVATRCASDFGKIIRCMDEGSKQIPSAPQDLHTVDIRADSISIRWQPASEDSLRADVEYHVRYQQLQQAVDQPLSASDLSALIAVVPLHPLEHNLILTTNRTEATVDKLKANSRYSIYVTAENPYGISLPSLVLVVQTPSEEQSASNLDQYKRKATLGAPHSLEILRSDTDSIVLKWIAPLFINSDAQLRYRVFYKLLSSQSANASEPQAPQESQAGQVEAPTQQVASNWTIVETSDTSILLRNLRYSSQYVISVQAYSKQLLGHMSEILLASTAKPIPPTLNHPLVIGNPVETNNITIMCVALGQPTPQISMFINGLLVQKRTQPYVIYHLVNLVRGHLTISCFASNGHGKDYASVQSRTEIDVKFASKASAKLKQVQVSPQSVARLSCEVVGAPQPTLAWTFSGQPSQDKPRLSVLIPSERISTLIVSQFDSPNSWLHTLSIRNVSQADVGQYQCRSRNILGESSDSIQLSLVDSASNLEVANSSQSLRQIEQRSDLMECCKSQNVSEKCLPVCSLDGLDVETAFKTPLCQQHLDKLMFCAADGSDHRNCCRNRQVPSSCLRWCSGAKLNIPALCFLSSAMDINQCFQEGRTLLPGAPRNVRALLASEAGRASQLEQPSSTFTSTMSMSMFPNDKLVQANNPSVISSMVLMMGDAQSASQETSPVNSEASNEDANNSQLPSEPLIVEWDPPAKNPQLVQYYRIFWRPFGSRELSRSITNLTWIRLNDLNMNKVYEFVVKAANSHGSSVYSDPLTVKPAEILAASNSISSAGLIWFMPSGGAGSIVGRVMVAVCIATMFMFATLAVVMLLEKRGYLKRFGSSKSNSSRISFANPAYLKDSDSALEGSNITWDSGHSLDILAPPPPVAPPNGQS